MAFERLHVEYNSVSLLARNRMLSDLMGMFVELDRRMPALRYFSQTRMIAFQIQIRVIGRARHIRSSNRQIAQPWALLSQIDLWPSIFSFSLHYFCYRR